MEHRQAIELIKRVRSGDTCPPGRETLEAFDMAISALEKQEQSNAQNVNSTHRSCPNALESLNILEQAKDEKGRVPMSLVRQAFRNVMEQDRWIPCSERPPEENGRYLITEKTDGTKVQEGYFCRTRDGEPYWGYLHVIAWRPLPEAYTEEES